MKDHLDNGIVPFWVMRAEDKLCGGYRTGFDENGDDIGTVEKYLNSQCRLIWTFSHLARKRQEIENAKRLAAVGFDFLNRHFLDAAFGGWRWKVLRDGNALDDGKIVYGQSFAIYALAEYTLGTGDARGLQLAADTFNLLQEHAADKKYGGYTENHNRDWSLEAPGFAGGDRKGLDTHMHLMESFTTLYEASGDPFHRLKLIELIDLIAEKMVDPESGCGRNQFTLDWTPIPAIAIKRTWNAERMGETPATPTDTTSYGHNVELAWLMRRALQVAKADSGPYEPMLTRLVDHAVAHGVDWQYGGIYRDGSRSGGALVLEKEFWQHAESLVGFLDAYEHSGDQRHLDALTAVWTFVRDYFILPAGEWRTLCDRLGKPIDSNIGNDWKVSYHTGRALIECVERLDRLIGYCSLKPKQE